MDDIVESTLALYIFDGDQAAKEMSFRKFLTIADIERILE